MKDLSLPSVRKIDFHNHIWLPGDPDGDQLVADMDKCGIERMVLHSISKDFWNFGDEVDILRAMRKHAGRFIGTVHLDFRQGVDKCRERIRRYAGEGFKGAKMFPNIGFYPDALEYDPIYDELAKQHLFATFHMGYMGRSDVASKLPASSKYSQPFFLEEPALRHPEINFVIGHMGGIPGYEQTLCVTRYYANIYADVAPGFGIEAFRHMGSKVSLVEFGKLMFGTDSPSERWDWKFKFWAENAAALGYEDKLPALFYDNATRFLSLYK